MAIWAIDLQRFDVAGTVRGPLVDGQSFGGMNRSSCLEGET
jgi:hypothetical protein